MLPNFNLVSTQFLRLKEGKGKTLSSVQIPSLSLVVKTVQAYIERYSRMATLEFWKWKLELDLGKLNVSKERLHSRLVEKKKVMALVMASFECMVR